jgi:hypothetical protein
MRILNLLRRGATRIALVVLCILLTTTRMTIIVLALPLYIVLSLLMRMDQLTERPYEKVRRRVWQMLRLTR